MKTAAPISITSNELNVTFSLCALSLNGKPTLVETQGRPMTALPPKAELVATEAA
jgi:hypothetical protein